MITSMEKTKETDDEKPNKLRQGPNAGEPTKLGAPRKEIDWKVFENCCKICCTLTEIANIFGCSIDTIENRVKEQWGVTFSEYYDQKSSDGKAALRRAQFQSAVGTYDPKTGRGRHGNVIAQMWLGKQLLGQKDKVEHSGGGDANDKPIQIDLSNARNTDENTVAAHALTLAKMLVSEGK
jgi:hypothetical protein